MKTAEIISLESQGNGDNDNVYLGRLTGGTLKKIYNCPILTARQNITVKMSADTITGSMEIPWTFVKINE